MKKQIQIRPVIYGDELRYEAYEETVKKGLFSDSIKYTQLYHFKDAEDCPWMLTTYESWIYWRKKGKHKRSAPSIKELIVMLKDALGTNFDTVIWRPS